MRDHLCIGEKCKEGIEYHKEFITEKREEIRSLKEDTKNGIQRKSKDNKSIIEARYFRIFIHEINDIRAKYSLGDEISSVEADFHNAVKDLEHTGNEKIGYIYMVWTLSLGILLETDKKNLERIGMIAAQKGFNDAVIDFLLCASDIGYTKMTTNYYKENPYAKTREIIELAQFDKKAASKRLQTYMEKEWFKGHYDYEWKNAHKEPGYVGFWSFETAALAKILELDDTSLMNNNHYPYDLAHYKNSMQFKPLFLKDNHEVQDSEKADANVSEGIEQNPSLEKMIPPKWHAFINELIQDYKLMDDSSFYEKYKKPIRLDQIWWELNEYEKENAQKNLLGTLIVFAMVEKGYILQLDYKEDLEEYYSGIKNDWATETKLVQFMLENDQNYYAYVPNVENLADIYEVSIEEVK